jgi:hypothetical protein
MNKLQALNTWMTPKMPLLILGALALGLLFPDQIGLLCPAVSALMMFQTFANSLGSSVDLASARAILSNLVQSGALERDMGQTILTAVGDKALSQVPRESRDAVRADILRQVLILQV